MGKQSQGSAVSHHSDVAEARGPPELLGGFGRNTRLSQISHGWLKKSARQEEGEQAYAADCKQSKGDSRLFFFFFSLALLILKAPVIRMRERACCLT